LLGWRARMIHRYGTAAYTLGLAVLAGVGVALFARWHLIIPTTTVLFAWLAGVSGGQYSGWASRILGRPFTRKEA